MYARIYTIYNYVYYVVSRHVWVCLGLSVHVVRWSEMHTLSAFVRTHWRATHIILYNYYVYFKCEHLSSASSLDEP